MQSERDPLQDSEALLRAMIENLPGGAAFVVDPDLRYETADRTWDKDFLAKMSIASKEARETQYWLRLLQAS